MQKRGGEQVEDASDWWRVATKTESPFSCVRVTPLAGETHECAKWLGERGDEQKPGVITDMRELRPMVGELDCEGNSALPVGSVSEVAI
jgi:hypothetical protein